MKKLVLICALIFCTTNALSKPLLIGTSPLNPPFETLAEQPNRFYGFDIDLMMEICRRIHRVCEFTPVMFNDSFTFIKEKKLDLTISSIIITPKRQAEFLFSIPYLNSRGRFLTLKSSSIETIADLDQVTIGTRLGTPYMEMLHKKYKKVRLKEYPLIANMMEDLRDKGVGVVLLDDEAAQFWVNNNENLYKLIGDPIPVGNGYGIMAHSEQSVLIKQINDALLDMEADGTYLDIYRRYF